MSDISSLGPNTTKIIQSFIPNENDIPQDQKPAATGPAASPLPNSPVTSLKPNAAPSGPVISTISTGSILGDIIKDENPLSTKTTDFIKSLAPNYNPEKFL